jgi:hypothetical protein
VPVPELVVPVKLLLAAATGNTTFSSAGESVPSNVPDGE